MILRSILFSLLVFPFLSMAQDFNILEKRVFTNKKGDRLPYRILYPVNYSPEGSYPLVLLLHGGGERGEDNEKHLAHAVEHFLSPDNRKNYPCILLVPQCPEADYWASAKFERTHYPLDIEFDYDFDITNSLRMAVDLTRQIMKKEAVDKKRVYVTGLSMGGMGTLEAVFRFPDLWAAAAIVCGGGDTEAFTKKHAKVPMWFFHGDVDGVIKVEYSRAVVEHLKNLGGDVQYTEYEGVNHNSWENAYADPALYTWLFSHKN